MCVLYSVLSIYIYILLMCVRRLEFIPCCRQKSVTSNFSDAPMRIKVNADVSATDTTQARVTQHDVANIDNFTFEYFFTIT